MEIILAIVIGVLGGSGVWLVLRARSYQVLMGLSLLSYAVNLFIFSMGSLFIDREPIVRAGLEASLENYFETQQDDETVAATESAAEAK